MPEIHQTTHDIRNSCETTLGRKMEHAALTDRQPKHFAMLAGRVPSAVLDAVQQAQLISCATKRHGRSAPYSLTLVWLTVGFCNNPPAIDIRPS